MSVAHYFREVRERDWPNGFQTQFVPPTIRAIVRATPLHQTGCACMQCRMVKFVARIDRIISKQDFNVKQ